MNQEMLTQFGGCFYFLWFNLGNNCYLSEEFEIAMFVFPMKDKMNFREFPGKKGHKLLTRISQKSGSDKIVV